MAAAFDDYSGVWKGDLQFLEVLCGLSGLPAALWYADQTPSDFFWTAGLREEHPCFTDQALRTALEANCDGMRPAIYFDNDQIYYGILPIGPLFLSFGPAYMHMVSETFLQGYLSDHCAKPGLDIPRVRLDLMMKYISLAACHFTGHAILPESIPIRTSYEQEWQIDGDLEQYQLDQSENERDHQPGIDFENDLLAIVQRGDPASIRSLFSASTPDFKDIGDISPERTKEEEYMAVSVITLLTRAAVAGGASAEEAHQLGDVYLKKLAGIVLRGDSFLMLPYHAMFEFAEMVRQAREKKSAVSYVDACKEYIEKNLRRNLQVGDIAPAIGISRTYLSRLFHEAEGLTVQQYIQREKCRHAARMLQYSDYPIAQIAQYFGFSSQSYFGSCFQQWYKMTPREYRKVHH